MAYLVDANVFISAKDQHFGFDFCPAFWDWMILKNSERVVFSIDRVSGELQAIADELSEWANTLDPAFFLNPDESVLSALRDVSEWARNRKYEPAAITRFLQSADYYLVAHALAGGYTVVSHEVPSNSLKRIKIPDACLGLSVRFMTPFDMLRQERARFVLGPAA